MRPPTDPDLITLHAAAVALARSMRGEPDARRFVEGLSPHLREVIPHDRLLLIREDETPVPSPASWLTLPLEGVDRAIGSLAIAASAPATYTEAHATTARRIAEMLGPLVENMVLLQKERDRRRTAVRTVFDFDLMLVRPIGASGTLQRSVLLVGDVPADLQPERRLEDYSFGARLAAKEIVLLGDARRELDQSFPGDRAALERGVRSVIVAPLVFGDTLGGVLAFAKHDPDWFDEGDAEMVSGIAAQVVVALQHQRLSEEQQRVAAAEQHSRWLERRVERLRGALAERYGFDSIMGRSGAIREALDQAALVAGQETTVLLTGESGTGKELVARAIHYASRRSDGPFVAVNCAALPETLAESELFGHERGAFTGADRLKRGRFEVAAGGTLFLDEIGDLTPSVQAKLLRVLQERQYERVGGTTSLRADVRLVTVPVTSSGAGRLRDRFQTTPASLVSSRGALHRAKLIVLHSPRVWSALCPCSAFRKRPRRRFRRRQSTW